MDFSISEKTSSFIASYRTFVDEVVIPTEPIVLGDDESLIAPAIETARVEAKSRGLWLPQMSAAHGGHGLTLVEFAQISEVLGRSILGHVCVNTQAPDAGNMEVLAEVANDAQKARFLAPLLAGDIRSCFAMTEPENAGSDPTNLSTTAVADGDQWVINGRKWFTSSADGAAFSIVMAVTDPDAPKHQRASMFIVPSDTPGFSIVRNIKVMGESGAGWLSHAEVDYQDVRVPADALLGEPGAGFKIAQQRLGPGRIHHCMRWIGICERAFEMMCQRAATRKLSDGVLGDKQLVQSWIAESRAEIDAARWMVLHAAWKIENEGARAARFEISTIKFYVANVLFRVLDRAIQAHGALGMTDDTPLAWWFRHERAARIYDGADEVHKAALARRVLRNYGGDA